MHNVLHAWVSFRSMLVCSACTSSSGHSQTNFKPYRPADRFCLSHLHISVTHFKLIKLLGAFHRLIMINQFGNLSFNLLPSSGGQLFCMFGHNFLKLKLVVWLCWADGHAWLRLVGSHSRIEILLQLINKRRKKAPHLKQIFVVVDDRSFWHRTGILMKDSLVKWERSNRVRNHRNNVQFLRFKRMISFI